VTAPCCVCGETRRRPALRHPDALLTRCVGCGLVSVDPLPTPEQALAPYDAAYFKSERGYRDYAAEEGVYRAEHRRRLARVSAAGGRGRLLDVGAATGACLLEAQTAGFRPTGLEPSADTAAAARARGLDVVTGTVESAAFPPAAFDVVTCFDALEHMLDPVAALRRMAEWLREDGLLALTVPDFGGAWARLSGAKWPFVTPWDHLHYFTRRSLCRALAAAGFRVTTRGSAGTPASFATLAREAPRPLGPLLERALGAAGNAGFSLPMGTLFAIAIREPTPARRS
jgi:SAM-dependent methyltransferase